MLNEWMIGNFKSIAAPTTLRLAPLTVLVGANSSGKSTILQSMLSVMQTFSSPLSATSRPLVLNGEYLKLGPIRDVLHQGSDKNPLEFGFTLSLDRELLKLLTLVDQEQNDQLVPSKHHIQVRASCIPVVGTQEDAPRLVLQSVSMRLDEGYVRIERPAAGRAANSPVKSADSDLYHVTNLDPRPISMQSVAELRAQSNYFLPWELREQYDLLVDKVRELLQIGGMFLSDSKISSKAINDLNSVQLNSPVGLEFRTAARSVCRAAMDRMPGSEGFELALQSLQNSLTVGEWLTLIRSRLASSTRRALAEGLIKERLLVGKRIRESRNYKPEYGFRSRPLPEPLNLSRTAVVAYFTNCIKYMGPLREDPQAVYVLPPIPEDADVGIRGEYTAAVLQHHRNDPVVCPTPGDIAFGSETVTLGEAVTRWLVHMGLVNDVTTYDRGKIGTELALHVADLRMAVDLTNVGVGVSQVLPTIVMGLLAPQGSTLLMEQPELHLHPKVQSILGDFLIGLARSGRQCIVESHSEYLVNRLRRRIAEAEGDSVQKLIQMYFVERTDGASVFRPVDPNEYGAIPDWPKGFFDQGPDEAQFIIQAATKKRQARLDALKTPKKEQ